MVCAEAEFLQHFFLIPTSMCLRHWDRSPGVSADIAVTGLLQDECSSLV